MVPDMSDQNLLFEGSPVVDIVIPVYNGSSHLCETLECIERQSYPLVNIYIVDDHSTDSTPDILASHVSRFPVSIIRHPVNRGLSAARNTGIAAGAGKYIAILDADDLWLPAKLEHQVGLIEASDLRLGIVSCDFQIIDEFGSCNDPTVYDYCCDLDPSTRDRLVLGNLVSGGSAALIRRECFEQCGGFDESLSACEDWEMWYRIAGHYSIRILREPLVLVRRHSKSMQGDTPRMLRNRIEVFHRFAQDPQSHRVAASCLFNECVAAFRYLSPSSTSSFDQAMLQLQDMGIDSRAVSPSIWHPAYRHYRLTSFFFSCWRFLDDRFRIRQRLSRSSQARWLYRGLRWRIQTFFGLFSR
jgi:glycosyltransferase involved in cell wall biosynthesis